MQKANPMNTHELMIVRALVIAADSCFDDLKQLGAISRPNAMDYRKCRQKALDTIGRSIASKPIPHPVPSLIEQALQALLVAIDCGHHEERLEASNPLCVQAARAALVSSPGIDGTISVNSRGEASLTPAQVEQHFSNLLR